MAGPKANLTGMKGKNRGSGCYNEAQKDKEDQEGYYLENIFAYLDISNKVFSPTRDKSI
jgi:hypothetical protein